jgi:hypothetical protein
MLDKAHNTPEFHAIWKEMEEIKNRNGGMPPIEPNPRLETKMSGVLASGEAIPKGWEAIDESIPKLALVESKTETGKIHGDSYRVNVVTLKDGTKYTVGKTAGDELARKGKTQLFRRIGCVELEKIFANPRQHTGNGYYTRAEAARRGIRNYEVK